MALDLEDIREIRLHLDREVEADLALEVIRYSEVFVDPTA